MCCGFVSLGPLSLASSALSVEPPRPFSREACPPARTTLHRGLYSRINVEPNYNFRETPCRSAAAVLDTRLCVPGITFPATVTSDYSPKLTHYSRFRSLYFSLSPSILLSLFLSFSLSSFSLFRLSSTYFYSRFRCLFFCLSPPLFFFFFLSPSPPSPFFVSPRHVSSIVSSFFYSYFFLST